MTVSDQKNFKPDFPGVPFTLAPGESGFLLDRDMYSEEFQFIDRTHSDKKEALENKATADGYRRRACGPAFRTASFTFRELAWKHELGMTFRRLPESARTRFMFLDIDHKQNPGIAPVTVKEIGSALPRLGYADYWYTHSTSGAIGNWHVFLLMDAPVDLSGNGYREAHDRAAIALSGAIMESRGEPESIVQLCDPHLQSPYQLLYGCPRDDRDNRIIVDGMSAPHLERTAEFPEPRWVDTTSDIEPGWNCRRVPTSPGEFARILRDDGIIPDGRIEMDYAFSAWLPFMKRGGSKATVHIPEGERHTVLNMFAFKLYCCFRAANLYASAHGFDAYTVDDLKGTFLALTRKACEGDTGSMETGVKSLMGLYGRAQAMTDMEWCRSNVRYAIKDREGRPRHSFRTGDHCKVESIALLDSRADSGVASFSSREELRGELSARGVSEASFRKHAKAAGVSVEVAGVSSRGGRPEGSSKVSLEEVLRRISGEAEGNLVRYSGKVSGNDRKILTRRGYRLKKTK